MSARGIAHVLFRQKRKIALVMLAALAFGIAVAQSRPPAFRAQATLMAGSDRPDAARALAALFESADLHHAILARLGERLYPTLAPPARPAAFAAALAVTPDSGASLVRVGFQGRDPKLAAEALSALMAGVEASNRAVFQPEGQPAPETGLDRAALVDRRARVETDRIAAEAEAAAQADTLVVLKQRLAATPATIAVSAESERTRVVEEARAKLFELETREQELLGKYQDESAFVRRVRAERKKVEALLGDLMSTSDTRVTQGANPVHQALETEVFRVEAAAAKAASRARALAAQRTEIDAKLQKSAGRGGRAAAVEGIGVVQAAFAPPSPVGPGPVAIVGLALVIGLVAALIVAVLAQRFSTRFATPVEVERRLGLPVLTTIPRES